MAERNHSALNFYLRQLKESGIGEGEAEYAGMSVCPEGMLIKYPTFNANALVASERFTSFSRIRHMYSQGKDYCRGDDRYSPLSTEIAHVYHPPVWGIDRREVSNDAGCPIFIVEGEKKSLCLALALKRRGRQSLVFGLPGMKSVAKVEQELFYGEYEHCWMKGRMVFIVADFNNPDKRVEKECREHEALLVDILRRHNCVVHLLRWSGDPHHEQKVDDWLVATASGDLHDAIEASKKGDVVRQSYYDKKMSEYNDNFAVYNGKVVCLDTLDIINSGDFKVMMAHDVLPLGPGQKRPETVAEAWLKYQYKNTIRGFDFLPAPLGKDIDEYIVVNGLRMLNLAKPFPLPKEEDLPWEEERGEVDMGMESDIPIVRLMWEFCDGNAEQFWFWWKHVAFCFLHPAHGTSQCHVFVSRNGGTGKSLICRAIRQVAGKMSVGIKDFGRFNGQIKGKKVIHLDESTNDRRSKEEIRQGIYRLVGNPTVIIEEKHRNPIEYDNYSFVMISTNVLAVTDIDDTNRRMNYYSSERVLSPSEVSRFVGWLDSEQFLIDMHAIIRQVEPMLVGFDSYKVGPESQALSRAKEQSLSPYRLGFESRRFEGKDIWLLEEVYERFEMDFFKLSGIPQLGKDLAKMLIDGEERRRIRKMMDGVQSPYTLICVRNSHIWKGRTDDEWFIEARVAVDGPKYS